MAKKTHELALCGVLCALAVAFLWLSGVIPLSTYAWPILASAALLPAREECRKSYAWSCFAAAAVLGLLLCADKEAALVFCFLGYYPLVKPNLDAISSKALRLFAKLGLCTVSMGVMYALIIFVFKLPAVVQEFSESAAWLLWATAAMGLLLFFVYDLLIDRLGMDRINGYMQSHGYTHSVLRRKMMDTEAMEAGRENLTSTRDIALLFKRLYRGKCVSPAQDREMLAIYKRQTDNDSIPGDLPQGTAVAHKTGEVNDFRHDGGIVYTPKGDYVLVIFTRDYTPYGTMAELSEKIYQAFVE